AYRDFYWRVLGIDPTKQRPAQEALLRRVLRGEPLPRINPVVDAGNAASVKYMVPIGLYDVAKIRGGPLRIRMSRKGEVFHPIGGSPMELEDQIVLAADGQILHIYPYRDSVETKIEEGTRDVLVVVAGVAGVGEERLVQTAKYLRGLLSLLGGVPAGEITLA
ncbi:phenylalanine--tRNA ligase beta subunit-related protein, partial [Pyrobaculum sp.]